MKLHPGYKWYIFHILTSEDIADVIPLFFLCFSFSFFFLFSKHSYLYNKKKITRWFEDMKFIFSWKKDFTSKRNERVKYFFHSKINFISSRHRAISSIYFLLQLHHIFSVVASSATIASKMPPWIEMVDIYKISKCRTRKKVKNQSQTIFCRSA